MATLVGYWPLTSKVNVDYHYECSPIGEQFSYVNDPVLGSPNKCIQLYQSGTHTCLDTDGTQKHRTLVRYLTPGTSNPVRFPANEWHWIGYSLYVPSAVSGPQISHNSLLHELGVNINDSAKYILFKRMNDMLSGEVPKISGSCIQADF